MSDTTKIQWCDSTINFWRGCTKVSTACVNCYAEALSLRFDGNKYVKGVPRILGKNAIRDAIKLNAKPWVCDDCGHAYKMDLSKCWVIGAEAKDATCKCGKKEFHRRRIFTNSLADMFDAEVPIEWLANALDTIRICSDVIWIICTKRPELVLKRLQEAMCFIHTETNLWISDWLDGKPPQNVWLLTSVENQEMADKRIPELLKIPARVRGLSVEPMLGPVDLLYAAFDGAESFSRMGAIHWVIYGGESGPNARPCNVEWIRDGVKQCKAAGVAAFVKQLGAYSVVEYNDPLSFPASTVLKDYGGKLSPYFADKKGGDMAEWPEDLQVREFPNL